MLIYCCHLSAKELLLRDCLAVLASALVRHIGIEEAMMQEEDRRCIAKGERKLHLLSFLALRHLRLELQNGDKNRFIYNRQSHHLLLQFATFIR